MRSARCSSRAPRSCPTSFACCRRFSHRETFLWYPLPARTLICTCWDSCVSLWAQTCSLASESCDLVPRDQFSSDNLTGGSLSRREHPYPSSLDDQPTAAHEGSTLRSTIARRFCTYMPTLAYGATGTQTVLQLLWR